MGGLLYNTDDGIVYLIESMNNLSINTYPVEVAVAVAQYSDKTYFFLTSASSIPKIKFELIRTNRTNKQTNNTVEKVSVQVTTRLAIKVQGKVLCPLF